MKNGVGDKSGERGENGSKITVVPKFATKVKKKGSKLAHCFTSAYNSNYSTFQERSAHRIAYLRRLKTFRYSRVRLLNKAIIPKFNRQ